MDESIFTINHFLQKFDNVVDVHYLLPFGDVHDGNPNCHYEEFGKWCDWATHNRPSNMKWRKG